QTQSCARTRTGGDGRTEPIAPGMIERLVKVRMRRQQVLDREPELQLSVVLDESVLKRRIGDEMVMHEQLQRLVREADRPNLTLQVLPLGAQRTGLWASSVLLRFGSNPYTKLRDLVSTSHTRSPSS